MIAIVSWPTLDPLSHNSEWNEEGDKSKQANDKAVVDINHIGIREENIAGFFGAYHIYPNYPDFMNNDIAYSKYSDNQGIFRYGGYLREFMNQHTRYPAVVAEYGISTSLVTAHFNPDGYDHGGLDEIQQGDGIVRMTEAIVREGYSGAIIFEWMDEWVKKTWTTEYYMIPYDRHVLWHNVLDPEQNYGLLAYAAVESDLHEVYPEPGEHAKTQEIQTISVGQNVEYLEIMISGSAEFDPHKPISIALSTYADDAEVEPTWEYLLQLGNKNELLVNPEYNWLKGKYASAPIDFSEYEPMIQITNKSNLTKEGVASPEKTINLSELKTGSSENNRNQVIYETHAIRIKLPYGLLGISDPSSRMVLYDEKEFFPTAIDQIGTRQTDKITIRIIRDNKKDIVANIMLAAWEVPMYTERLKDGFDLLASYFAK